MKNAELIARLRLGASISRERKLNQGYDAVADEAADTIEALESQLAIERRHNERATNHLQDQRDALAAQLAAAQGQCDTITELNHAQWLALENVRMLAARNRKEEWAQHLTRFCNEAGNVNQILRAAPIPQQPAPSVPDWKRQLEAVVDIYFDGTENPEEHRTYADGAFAEVMNDSRAMLAAAPQPKETK